VAVFLVDVEIELERLAAELGCGAKVALINVDEESELAGMFDVSSILNVFVSRSIVPSPMYSRAELYMIQLPAAI
jgi:hypothetical protein